VTSLMSRTYTLNWVHNVTSLLSGTYTLNWVHNVTSLLSGTYTLNWVHKDVFIGGLKNTEILTRKMKQSFLNVTKKCLLF